MMKFMRAKKAIDFNIPNTTSPSPELESYINDPKYGIDYKCDGTRALIVYDEEGVPTIYGRGTVQKELHSQERIQREYNDQFPEFTKKIPELALTSLDTELVVNNPNTGEEDYNLLQKRANRKTNIDQYARDYPAVAKVFDIQKYQGEDLTSKPLQERINVLINLFWTGNWVRDVRMRALNIGLSKSDKELIVKHALHSNAEGVMIKDLDAIYKHGSGEWFKAKRVHTEDVFVLGMSEGNGKFAPYFGQLHCYQFDDNGNIEFVCSVGGGFDFKEMKKIKEFYGHCFGPPHHNQTDMKNMYRNLKSSNKLMVIEIKHYGIVKKGRRHPVFIRMRDDKDAEECIGRDSSGNDQSSLEEFI